jgi:hypothetical protein
MIDERHSYRKFYAASPAGLRHGRSSESCMLVRQFSAFTYKVQGRRIR